MKNILTAIILLAIASSPASAQVIYQDSFSVSGDVNGGPPDVTNVPQNIYVASEGYFISDGSVVNYSDGAGFPYTPTALLALDSSYSAVGNTITLSADLSVANGGFVALQFANAATDGNGIFSGGEDSLLLHANGLVEAYTGQGLSGGSVTVVPGTDGQTSAFGNLKEVLSIGGTSATNTLTYYLNNVQVGSVQTGVNVSDLNAVGFEVFTAGSTGSVDNFIVSYTTPGGPMDVPEPSQSLLVLCGAMGLGAFLRFRKPAL